MTGLLNPKSQEVVHFCLQDSGCVPRPWDFSSGIGHILFPKAVFGRGLKLPN